MNSPNTAESDVPEWGHPSAWVPAGSLRATDLGKWVMCKGLDRPKQIIYVAHGENTTSIQWFADPAKRDRKAFTVTHHDRMLSLYVTEPTRVTSPGDGEAS